MHPSLYYVLLILQQLYSRRRAAVKSILIPDARLHLADMGRAHHQHTES